MSEVEYKPRVDWKDHHDITLIPYMVRSFVLMASVEMGIQHTPTQHAFSPSRLATWKLRQGAQKRPQRPGGRVNRCIKQWPVLVPISA